MLVIPFVQAVSLKQQTQSKKNRPELFLFINLKLSCVVFFHKKRIIMEGITAPILAVSPYNSENERHGKTFERENKTKEHSECVS